METKTKEIQEIPEIKVKFPLSMDNEELDLKKVWTYLLDEFAHFESSLDSLVFTKNFELIMETMKLNRENQCVIQYFQLIIDRYIEFFSTHINNSNLYPSMYRLFSYLPIQTSFLLFRNIKTGKLTSENQIKFKTGLSDCDFISMNDCEKLKTILSKIE